MMKRLISIEKEIAKWFQKHGGFIAALVLFGSAVYFMLMSQELVNCYDGSWWNSRFIADAWERSIGRWMWPYIDMLRFGVVSVALNTFLTLLLEAIAVAFLLDIFQIESKVASFLIGALFVSAPLTCDALSYAYMSPTFGMAFLLSIISVVLLIKLENPLAGVILCGMGIACSMGCYQAYLGVTCVVMLFLLLEKILEREDIKELGFTALKMGVSVIFSGGVYKAIVTVTNRFYQVPLADYRGINNVSLKSILVNLPYTIPRTYKDFYNFFFSESGIQKNLFGNRWIYLCIFVIAGIGIIGIVMHRLKQSMVHGLLFLIILFLIPVACNVSIILASENNTNLLMSGGMTLLPGLLLCVIYTFYRKSLVYHVFNLVLCASLWVNICLVTNDQIAMRDGRTATATLTQNIVTELFHGGYLDNKPAVVFVGSPYHNKFFNRTEAFNSANAYAQFGKWWLDAGNNRRSWQNGMLLHCCGVDLEWCDDMMYDDIIASGQLEEMKEFPEDDSIRVIEGIVVVKVSDTY